MSTIRNLASELSNENPEFAFEYEIADLVGFLVSLRMQKGWTQKKVAEVMGVHQARISQIENLNGDISVRTLVRYARAVGGKVSANDATPSLRTKAKTTLKPKQTHSTTSYPSYPMAAKGKNN